MLKKSLQLLFHLLFRVTIQGESTIVHPERLLVVANHESFLDGLRAACFAPLPR